jgi:hypothetical protein
MSFDWQSWLQKFISNPGYNDTDATISEAIRPAYVVLGVHRLTPSEDYLQRFIYVDVLDKEDKRQVGEELEYNSVVSEPIDIPISRPFNEIASFSFSGEDAINVWHRNGEGVFGLKPGYSYLVVFKEADRSKPKLNLGGIQVTVNQEWIANMKPDSQGNVTFFVDIKQ